MTLTVQVFAFLTCITVMVSYCEADRLPPPTGLSYKWLDPFTVNLFWLRPTGLPDDCEIEYQVQREKGKSQQTVHGNINYLCLTEDVGSAGCTFNVHTVKKCNMTCDRNMSTPVTITAHSPYKVVHRDEVVKNFKCLTYANKMECSWIPLDPSDDLTLSYRICGVTFQDPIKSCNKLHHDGEKSGCYLNDNTYTEDICMIGKTKAGQMTFKRLYEIPSPKLNVTEEGNQLKLSWTSPEIGKICVWIYEVCYKQCGNPIVCRNFTTRGEPMRMAYDKRCRYEFQSKARTDIYCPKIQSDFDTIVYYGTDEPPDGTLIEVAIVIPIILFICIILSCYCFRRHRAIICPIIPDPSAIFKEMIMNGNKELKTTTGSLYTPMPEHIDPCRITLVPENIVLKQNS
ncbi:hypothetical protein PAMP_015507 [Pampus punctatissimus]